MYVPIPRSYRTMPQKIHSPLIRPKTSWLHQSRDPCSAAEYFVRKIWVWFCTLDSGSQIYFVYYRSLRKQISTKKSHVWAKFGQNRVLIRPNITFLARIRAIRNNFCGQRSRILASKIQRSHFSNQVWRPTDLKMMNMYNFDILGN